MKRLIFFFFVLLPMMVAAQNDIKLYDELCEPLQAVFCDYVKEGEVKYISTPDGQYVGHLIDNVIYGWGRFLADNGTQVYGQYSRGKLMFGIIMNGTTARVGGDVNYVEYDPLPVGPCVYTPSRAMRSIQPSNLRYTHSTRLHMPMAMPISVNCTTVAVTDMVSTTGAMAIFGMVAT